MEIVIIGTGNTATVIGKKLVTAGNDILQVFGRNSKNAEDLAVTLNSKPCNSWDHITRQADFYLVAIADKALYELEHHFHLRGGIVLHTAGSVSKGIFKNITSDYGVLYPLQSIRKEMPVLTEIPLLVDASNEQTLEKVLYLARQISGQVSLADDEKRLRLHLAAVCLNNFTNHLYQVAADFCQKEHVEFNLLLPLLLETAKRMELVSPDEALTGPAIRNDQVTINRHLDLLQSYPLFYRLYEQMTRSIREFNNIL